MSIAALVQEMADAGAAPQVIAIAVRAVEAASAEAKALRSRNAERQARYRERHSNVTHNVTSNAIPSPSPSSSLFPLDPPSQTLPPIIPQNLPPSAPPTKRARSASSEAFLRFWSHWPHKVGRPAAERAFGKVDGELDAILAGLERYIRDKPPDRPWLNPATFLNQRRWEDSPAQVSTVGQVGYGQRNRSLVDAGLRLIRNIDERAAGGPMRAEAGSDLRDDVIRLLSKSGS